eukprot:SAG31_NODE_1918_length_6921_cov_2.015245_7_plen_84_part_00
MQVAVYKKFGADQIVPIDRLKVDEIVEVLQVRRGDVVGYLEQGHSFGYSALLQKKTCGVPERENTVTAMTHCDLAYLPVQEME